jgi:hypothetical protein
VFNFVSFSSSFFVFLFFVDSLYSKLLFSYFITVRTSTLDCDPSLTYFFSITQTYFSLLHFFKCDTVRVERFLSYCESFSFSATIFLTFDILIIVMHLHLYFHVDFYLFTIFVSHFLFCLF